MSLSQALKLANVELAGLSGKAKLQRFGQIVRLFASEVVGTVQLAPFALKASQLYSKLPAPTNASSSSSEVCLVKSIYYGSKPRNTVDLYLPPAAQQQHTAAGLPVVLFVHGGESSKFIGSCSA
jgi:acetyl esterase/lipase